MVDPDKIQIVDFVIEKAALNSTFGKNSENVINHNVEVNYNVGFNVQDNLVKSDISVTVMARDAEQEIASGQFDLVFIFLVENLSDLITQEEDGMIVNGGLNTALASISYSTTRGILMTRFQGTLLRDFILPVIDPKSLLK